MTSSWTIKIHSFLKNMRGKPKEASLSNGQNMITSEMDNSNDRQKRIQEPKKNKGP